MDTLTVRSPTFYAPGDEAAFFWWLKRIRAVAHVSGRGYDLQIQLRPGRISADEVRELRAIFHRYGLDTTDLSGLEKR